MFKVTTVATIKSDNSVAITAKAKGKQATLKVTSATPERFAEAAATVLRKLDTVPSAADILSCTDTEDTELNIRTMVFAIA
jgi:hypothetical protein